MMKRIPLTTMIITLSALLAFALRASLQTQRPGGLELARFMPASALVYVEFRDLNNLLTRWRASTAHERYYESANWKQFQRSRLFLKLQQRLEPVQTALGFEITEARLEGLAGGRSAVAVYDIGELQVLYVSQMSRQLALGSALFKQSEAFQERSIEGLMYYVREGVGDEDRRRVVAGFAFADGKLFVASSENLLRRALANVKGDSQDRLSPPIARLTDSLDDFSPHDITIWLDQKRLNQDRYFRNYWIHRNHTELTALEFALIDVSIDDGEIREQRWFKLPETSSEAAPTLARLNELLRFAPASAHLVTARRVGSIDRLSHTVAEFLLGRAPPASFSPTAMAPAYSYSPSSVDRFNKEIDDPTSYSGPRPEGAQPSEDAPSDHGALVARLKSILEPTQPAEFLSLGEAGLDEHRLFVSFNRALIIKLAHPDAFRSQAFEDAVREEFANRYAVRGIPHRLAWRASGQVRFLSQALLDRGGAHALIGDTLILANRSDYGARVVEAYKASSAPAPGPAAALERFAEVRIQQGKDAYTQVMEMLAAPQIIPDANEARDLFSDNIASLINLVPDLKTVALETWRQRQMLRQRVTYRSR